MLQPQLPIIGMFDEPVKAFEGIPQAYAVTEHEQEDHPRHGLWGFRVEAIMGTPGIVATLLPFQGLAAKELMKKYAHVAASLLLTPDEPSGTVSLSSSGRPVVTYEHRENHKRRLRQAIKVAARIYLAAGAREVVVPLARPLRIGRTRDLTAVDGVDFAPATAPLLSAHQQGGVRFAASARSGGADLDGRVYGTRDVYVFDSSGFPSSSSSHTMTPIITISRYLTSRLISRLG
jgi:choline dehydrogenase-like flavoprotein